ncbi:hypothetical protein EMIHUDRAFT_98020 [Emiliania huxleyi CCMP1516]|uniref:RING-type domain-containing protein n=2 Tax=Emiliania huxleyi TaxID=2903 RepID=A0A0D3KQV1_EMIH1|nr:hypothetical protein EMIHUDRAFT_98020 [Emiliania huxleyi CCMP1516]EOD38136.1 hypothetical protein EMIHUDRAFT_98020 [Emiliania huxleyi CCMP1516]|eukprot:XP_005790565.1 hypothetical protein EMIHUDRAFT_98020 [Emiliania huxleyi CCMP1516]
MVAPARASSSRATASERLMLIPAIDKRNTSGYKNVTYSRSKKKFEAKVHADGKRVHLGRFDTAEEAATAYARSERREGLTLTASSSSNSGYKGVRYCPKERGSKKYQLRVKVDGKDVHLGRFDTAEQAALFYARREAGRDTSDLTAPPPLPPPPEPSSAAGAEAVRQVGREGLTLLVTSSSSNNSYRGVCYDPKREGSKKYQLKVMVGGKQVSLGWFATAEEAALALARHLWDTTVRLLEPQPQQAPPQGAAGPSEASSYYYEEEDSFDPTDIADATALSLLSDPPPSVSKQRAARWQARAAEPAARADAAATAAAQAAAGAAPPWDEVEVEVEAESDSEEESEMEVEAAAAVAGVSAATAAEEEALECVICLDDLSAHPEARLQSRDPNGWGATRCCQSLFHYRCLHTWLSDDSEVETSRGMEPINTACPGCRGFVSKSASRMLS